MCVLLIIQPLRLVGKLANIKIRFWIFCNGKNVFPESERYEECLFGYSRIVHTDIYVLSLSCLAMAIKIVRDKGSHD